MRKTIAGYECELLRWEDVILDIVNKRRDFWMPIDAKVRKRVGALEFDHYEWDIVTSKLEPDYTEKARKVTLAPRAD